MEKTKNKKSRYITTLIKGEVTNVNTDKNYFTLEQSGDFNEGKMNVFIDAIDNDDRKKALIIAEKFYDLCSDIKLYIRIKRIKKKDSDQFDTIFKTTLANLETADKWIEENFNDDGKKDKTET